jgi:hypothetical protein
MTVLQILRKAVRVPTPECRRRLELGLSRYLREQEDIARLGSLNEEIAEAKRAARGKE